DAIPVEVGVPDPPPARVPPWLDKAGSLGLPEYLVTDYRRKLEARLVKEVELDKQMGFKINE
ncbi:MAG: hypothetical protein R6V75_03725, partial [Bacteroidales bacterium]